MTKSLEYSDHVPPIEIGFYDPFEVYQGLEAQFSQKINLTNLHWRKDSTGQLRSIPQLHTKFVEELPKSFDNNSNSQFTTLDQLPKDQWIPIINKASSTPLVRLMFVKAKDIDEYRSLVRPLIEAWMKSNIQVSNCPLEWFIILYSDSKDSKSNNKVFEKLKTDFNFGSNNQKPSNKSAAELTPSAFSTDRIVSINGTHLNVQEENETWNVLNTKLKSGILEGFQSRILSLQKALTLSHSKEDEKQKPLSRYDLVTILTLTDSIAYSFLKLRLFEDALTEYDQMEKIVLKNQDTAFTDQTWKSQNIKPFTNYIEARNLWDPRINDQEPTLLQIKTYVFTKQFIILEGLSVSASSSLSLQSIHIAEFLRRLSLFLADISSSFYDENNDNLVKYEWIYILIDTIVQTESCKKIIKSTFKDADQYINEISEKFGELSMLQRSKLEEIGHCKGFDLPNLMGDRNQSSIYSSYEIKYPFLVKSLSTKESFEKSYIRLTEDSMKHFNAANRPRSVDILSIDIALLDLQNKNYEKAVTVLSSCPDFYCSQGWEIIGFTLLEKLIECLENIEDSAVFFNNAESLNKDTTLAKYYLDYLVLVSTNETFKSLERLTDIKEKLSNLKNITAITHNVNGLFEVDVDRFVETLSDDTFQLTLSWKNKLPEVHFDLKDIQLILKSNDETMTFKSKTVLVDSNVISIKLTTRDIHMNKRFLFNNVTANFKNIALTYEFEENFIEIPSLSSNCTSLNIGKSTNISLFQKSFSLFINTKSTPITDIQINYSELSFKNIRFVEGAKIIQDAIKINSVNFEKSVVSIQYIPENSNCELSIPYDVVNSTKATTLSLSATLSYIINGKRHSQSLVKSLDATLGIAVSVQDIFKINGLYTKFTIATADNADPVVISDVNLAANEKFSVCKPAKSKELIALKDQLGLYFFKIEKIKGGQIYAEEFLKLDLKYRDLRDEILLLFEKQMIVNLKKRDLMKYYDYLNIDSVDFNYERYVTDKYVEVANSTNISNELCRQINLGDSRNLIKIFNDLINEGFRAPNNAQLKHCERHLFINVQIPLIDVVHEVDMKLPDISPSRYFTVGEEIQAELKIKSQFHKIEPKPLTEDELSKKSKKRVLFQDEQDQEGSSLSPTCYRVEILSNQDPWIINGLNTFNIEIDPKTLSDLELVEHGTINLSLIPLKTGKVTLPKIKITRIGTDNIKDTFQVDYKNENEVISIISAN